MKTRIPITLYLLVFSCVAVAEFVPDASKWLCVGEHTTGFYYNKSKRDWQETSFRGHKYLISKSNNPKHFYEVKILGKKWTVADCGYPFSEYGYLTCEGLGGEFRFNRVNLRFLKTSVLGFMNVLPETFSDEESDTPFIEIGHCVEIL